MYTAVLSMVFLFVGIWLYWVESNKKPKNRNIMNLLVALFATIMGTAILILAVLYLK